MTTSRRPADESTNPKTSGVPSAAQQPGVLGPSNPSRDARFGPTPNRSTERIITAQDRRAARRERLEDE